VAVIDKNQDFDYSDSKSLIYSIEEIQKLMFELGGYLSSPESIDASKFESIMLETIQWFEDEMDRMNSALPKLTNFILPGGDLSTVEIHRTRTLVRRLERGFVHYKYNEENSALLPRPAHRDPVFNTILIYINRLSDYLFVLARYCHVQMLSEDEIIWTSSCKK
jgi:cob(I)alamin adenosyltransferase